MFITHLKIIKKGGGRGGLVISRLMLMLFLILVTISPSGRVSAQCFPPECYPTETPTPAPTNTPYYAPTSRLPISGTPTPLVQGDCPIFARDPERELSLNWMKACSKCPTSGGSVITPIPRLPTISYGNLGTLVPTAVITPGVTATSIPNNNITVYGKLNNSVNELINPEVIIRKDYIKNNGGGGNIWGFIGKTNNLLPITFGVHQSGHISITSSVYEMHTFFMRWFVSNYISNGVNIEIIESNVESLIVGTIYHIDRNSTYSISLIRAPINSTVVKDWDIKYNVELLGINEDQNQVAFEWVYTDEAYFGSYVVHTDSQWFGDPYIPNAVGYCNNYVYADEEEDGDPLVGIPDIDIWQGQCLEFVPPFSWFRDSAGSYLFDVDLSFPGIGICPIWVELGDMELAGISIPMDILFLPAVMFIFGLLFKM